MPRVIHSFDPPERFVAGTVGEPGHRTFYLQARAGHRICSVALEKQQVALLADRLDSLLDQVLARTGGAAPIPALLPPGTEDNGPLEMPLHEEFRVGGMTLAWDSESGSVIIEAFELLIDESDPDDPDDPNDLGDPTLGHEPDDDDGDELGDVGQSTIELAPIAFALGDDSTFSETRALQGDERFSEGGDFTDDDGDAAVTGDVLEVRMSGAMARGFVVRARKVVSAGRAACPLCNQPLDAQGHVCPRQNGYRLRG